MSELLFSAQQKWIVIYTLINTWQENITVVHVTIFQVTWQIYEEQIEIKLFLKKKNFPFCYSSQVSLCKSITSGLTSLTTITIWYSMVKKLIIKSLIET